MNVEDLFASHGGNGVDLPRPNAEMRNSGDEGEWTPKQIRGIICNPIYAGIGPYPQLVDDKAWVRAAATAIDRDSKEQFLVNLLFLLRRSVDNAEAATSDHGGTRQPVLTIHNRHSAQCGTPPQVNDEAGGCYVGYFENPFGEQWVFTFDPKTRKGTLRGGDIGWEQVCPVHDGRPVGVTLGQEEAVWLADLLEGGNLRIGQPWPRLSATAIHQ